MKAHVPLVVECAGSVKHCGYCTGQSQSWKSGKILVFNRDGHWWCGIIFDCQSDKLAASVMLKKDVLKKIVCKSRLLVEFSDGQTFILTNAKNEGRLHELNQFLLDLRAGRIDLNSPIKPVTALKENLITSPVGPQTGEKKEFTRVKEPKSKSGWEPILFADPWQQEDLEKENTNAKKSQPVDFLNRGSEKSRETLKTIGASGFYSNKTQTPYRDRVYGPFSTNSSTKRTPGLMPDPSPNKRPRLSNIPYSWSKNKTASHSDSKTQSTLQGFSNLGNTCYMNAILQALFGLENFATDVLVGNRRLLKSLPRESLYHNLAKLLSVKKKFNVADSTRRDLLRSVKSAISSSAKRFSGYQQHDAHEFLGQVLDQLKEEVVKLNKATPSPSKESSTGEITMSGQEFLNPTIQNFEFEVLHTIKCTECGETVTKTEQFNDLSLDLPRKYDVDNPQTIQDALDSFLRKEEIEYSCSECSCKQSEVFHSFTRLPRVLILHLKRYAFSVAASKNKKMGQTVSIPRYLTLQSQCDEETQPPFPPLLSTVNTHSNVDSPVHAIDEADGDKTDATRRKLEYNAAGHRFNGTFRRVRSTGTTGDHEDSDGPAQWITLKKKPKIEEIEDIRVPDQEDEELVQALELSLQGTDTEELTVRLQDKSLDIVEGPECEPAELNEDQQLQRVLEMSRLEAAGNNTMDMSSLQPENMTEDELFRLALERSMMESTNEEPENDTYKPTNMYGRRCSADSNSSLKGGWSQLSNEATLDHTYDSAAPDLRTSHCGSGPASPIRKRRVSCTITRDPEDVMETSEERNDSRRSSPVRKCRVSHAIGRNLENAIEASEECLDSKPSPPVRKRRVSHTITCDPENVIEISEDDTDNEILRNTISSPCAVSTFTENAMEGLEKRLQSHSGSKRGKQQSQKGIEQINRQSQSENATLDARIGIGDHVTGDGGPLIKTESSGEITEEERLVLIAGATDPSTEAAAVESGGDNYDEVDGGRLPLNNKMSIGCSQTDVDFLSCQENDEDLEDKENKTPPKNSPAVNFKLEPDWIMERRNSTNKEVRGVITLDLDEEDEDIRRAKELSLQELDNQQDQSFEEPPHVDPPYIIRSKEENDALQKHFEEGHLPYAYRLVSVVSHIGSTSSMGHYVSDVYDFKKGGWFSYDDSHVSKTCESDVRLKRERTGYIFFYMCKDINEDLVTNSKLELLKRKPSVD